jgi:1-phosphatidylinositol phosphodiesterase
MIIGMIAWKFSLKRLIRQLWAAGVVGWAVGAVGLVHAAGNDWMAGLPDTTRLSAVTLPGTHNAGARFEPLAGTAQCQTATIAEQLGFGIRLLDVRCRHLNDGFQIYHGPIYQKIDFAEVLRQVLAFLDENPRECVILSVKEEGQASGNTRNFAATFDSYVAPNRARWYLTAKVPVMQEVRGRIVLLRRFGAAGELGIGAASWPDNSAFKKDGLIVQDHYQVKDLTTKWNEIATALNDANTRTNANPIHLNFTSGYQPGTFGLPNIRAVSNAINPQLADYFRRAKPGFYGWVIMDFATADLAELIFRQNLPSGAGK